MTKKKIFFTVVFPILLVVVLSTLIFKQQMDDNFAQKLLVITKVNWWWLIVAIVLTTTWWIIETTILQHNATIEPKWKHYSFKDAFIVTMVGVFYMTVTPFSSGGHAFQIFYLKKQGFKTAEALLVIVMNFIMYTWAMVLIAIFFFLFEGRIVKKIYPPFLILFWAGIALNIIQNLILILATSWEKFHQQLIKFYMWILKLVKKFKKNINIEQMIVNFEEDLQRYRKANKYLLKHKVYVVKQISLNVIRFMLFAVIPIIISFALNMHYNDFGDFINKSIMLIGTSIFMLVLQTVVPTPGASGAAEIFLSVMWASIFNDTISAPIAMILWRLITYYLHIFVSMPITFVYLFKYSKRELINE